MIRAARLACTGLIVLVSWLHLPEREARAGRIMVTLAYAADSGCPDATEFKSVVVGRLGYDPFVDGSTDHVLVRLERRAGGGGMHGRIEWRDPAGRLTGEQSFPSEATECSGLARAVGFALAVQIQFLATANPGTAADGAPPSGLGPSTEARGAAPGPSPAPPADPAPETGSATARPEGEQTPDAAPPATPPEEIVASPEPHEPRSGPTFAIGAGPSVGFGFSASAVALGRLFGAVSWQRLSIEVAAAASLPETIRRKDDAGFEQQHIFGSAALCAAPSRWNGCLLANAGQVWMAGQNIDRPTSAKVALFQVGLRAGIVQPLGGWAFVAARADGLINLTRWTGSLDQVPVWTAPRFGAALGLDAGVRFR